jgi:hypothetical protein
MRRSITVEAYISEAHIEFIFHLLTICIILFSNVGGGWGCGWGGRGEVFSVFIYIADARTLLVLCPLLSIS